MKTRKSNILGNQVMVDGMMAFGKLENGLRTLDFECCEDVVAEAFQGNFHVQGMRDGNVYMTENPKRKRKRKSPEFRDDNCTLSLGTDNNWYFKFVLPDERINELPQLLVRQSGAIAQKVLKKVLFEKEVLG